MSAPLIATLPMYDWPETASSWDALWRVIHARLAELRIAIDPRLHRGDDPWAVWRDPALILGQTCGWPYVSALRGEVLPMGRFDFGLPVARQGDYFSVFIAKPDMQLRAGSPRDLAPVLKDPSTTIAVNAIDSQSGFRAWGECLDGAFELPATNMLVTGSHRESIRAVAEGRAVLAAIDAVTWRIALAHEPAAQEVAVVGRSADMPGLPLVIAAGLAQLQGIVFTALAHGVNQSPSEIRSPLGLKGVVAADDTDYDILTQPPYGNLRVAGMAA
ncbi:MAG: PhnD/SsuA/transferrin family substrate-binding protein [Salaquimonas sp.]|nr:PhnD/SsuA/transferrin family substrate-binding protein [Salaquimonas sp.]